MILDCIWAIPNGPGDP